MAALLTDTNRNLGNKSYADKAEAYRLSEFETTKSITENFDEWTQEKIQARQAWMAKQAVAIWQVQF